MISRLWWLSFLGLLACTAHHNIGAAKFNGSLTQDFDVLVVVDNSPDMSAALPRLAQAFPAFVNKLQESATSLHVVFITSDITSNTPAIAPTCQAGDHFTLASDPSLPGAPVLEWAAQQPDMGSANDSLDGALKCLFPTTTGGRPPQLLAAVAAVKGVTDHDAGVPPDFRRPNANLVVMFVAGHDDCSQLPAQMPDGGTTDEAAASFYECARHGLRCDYTDLPMSPPQDPKTFSMCESAADSNPPHDLLKVGDIFNSLGGAYDKQTMVVVVGGPTTAFTIGPNPNGEASGIVSSCNGNDVSAQPPVRLQELANSFRSNGFSISICDALEPQLQNVGNSVATRGRCLPGLPFKADASDKPMCDFRYSNPTDNGTLTLLPCEQDPPPSSCYRLAANPDCPGSGWEISVEWGQGPTSPRSLEFKCFGTSL
jgi:hypothetical protein